MNPVTLHPLLADESMVDLRVECPHTGQVICTTLTLNQQRELLVSLTGSVARGERIDPYAPAVTRFEDWKAQHAEGCADCDPTPAPCTCEVAQGVYDAAILEDVLNGRR